MTDAVRQGVAARPAPRERRRRRGFVRGRLFGKYVALFVAVVTLALLLNGAFEIWFAYQDHEAALVSMEREQSAAAADRIGRFIADIQSQLGWTTELPWTSGTLDQRRFDALRLLRQVPAITELAQLDPSGKEQLRVSRLEMDVVGAGTDDSHDPSFTEAMANKVWYGPVYFRRESEPYMTLALAGTRRDAGVSVAEVNLKFIWDVVSQIKVGEHGLAYVVDREGRLIAHPDISLVLRNTNLARLPQVAAAMAGAPQESIVEARDPAGHSVLTAYARVEPLGWLLFVELPASEASAPLYASIERAGALLAFCLALAGLAGLYLARRMVVPIRALGAGAARIGGGDLAQRIEVKTGDELEALADQFNDMAARLQESYAGLERKVEERTRELSVSLERQTATADILRVIASTPGDPTRALDTIAVTAVRMFNAANVGIRRVEGDMLRFVAAAGPGSRAVREQLRDHPLHLGDLFARCVLENRQFHTADLPADIPDAVPATMRDVIREVGFRSAVFTPLTRDGRAIGAMAVNRIEVRPFEPDELELMRGFADQAVIAIENARLLSELRESLDRQTATAEVLRVISSSPGELEPVFRAMLDNATRLCAAEIGYLVGYEDGRFPYLASVGFPDSLVERWRRGELNPGLQSAPMRMVVTRETVHVADITKGPAFLAGEPAAVAAVKAGGARTGLYVPMLKDAQVVGGFILQRNEVQPFTSKQIELVENFAKQAVIAIENTRLLTELRESLERQTATSEVLGVMSSRPGELAPVFEAVLENARQICGAKLAALYKISDDIAETVATTGVEPELDAIWRQGPIKFGPETGIGRMATARAPVLIQDLRDSESYRSGHPWPVAAVQIGGARTVLFVPMFRENELVGAINVYRQEVKPFTQKQIELLQNFAKQAVIAIENARLLSELREALDRQTATADILRVIASTPSDPTRALDTIAETAVRMFDAANVGIRRLEGDKLRFVATAGPQSGAMRSRLRDAPLQEPDWLSRSVLENRQFHREDLQADIADWFPELRDALRAMGARTAAFTPLSRDGRAIGAMAVNRSEVRPFRPDELELMRGFADQAVIAIENARLLTELRESLERQTATSEVLSVISASPGELAPVFEAMLGSAARLCEADQGVLWRIEGDVFHPAARYGTTLHRPEGYRHPPNSLPQQMRREKRTIHTDDLAAYVESHDDPTAREVVERSGVRAALLVPLLKDGEVIGGFTLQRREAKAFSDKQVELVESFAKQAVIAIENARLLNELRARTDELARSVGELRALGEVSQTVNSTLDVETVLTTIVANSVKLSETDAGAIYVFDDAEGEFTLHATVGMDEAMIAAIGRERITLDSANIGEAASRRRPVQIADLAAEDRDGVTNIVLQSGFRALLVVPLLRPDRILGALVVRRRAPGAFPDATVELIETFAAQSVVAIQNARLFHEIEEKSQELAVASRHKSQFLANMSHELRTPLNAILGYTELILDDIYGAAPPRMREVLERVQTNGKHLLGLINDVLDLSKIEAGQLTLALGDFSVPAMLHGVYVAVEPLAAAKKLALTLDVPQGLPAARGDERRLSQVVLNLVGNAIKFTDAGEVKISAGAANGSFTVAVRDTGPGIAPADQQKIFEEFQQADNSSTRAKGGTGLGLAISRRIVEMHGGRLWVESAPGAGATFSFTLPVLAEAAQ